MTQPMKDEGAIDAFIAGRGPLAAALHELPEFEPPARMAGQFQRMLASMPAGAPAFEPPARLEAAVLGEIARQQAAQSTRRDAVLGEIARGANPAAALDARLSPATEDWVREQSLPGDGARALETGSVATLDQGRSHGAKQGGKQWLGWPAVGWRYAGGGLAAVLAFAVGLRMMLEPAPGPAPANVVLEQEAEGRSAGEARPGPDTTGLAADSPRSAAAARRRAEPGAMPREQAMRERRAMAPSRSGSTAPHAPLPVAPAPPPAPYAPAPAPSAPPFSGPKADAVADGGTGSRASVLTDRDRNEGDRLERHWSLADDPLARLAGLPPDQRWVLWCHPGELVAARQWLQRGLDALSAASAAGDRAPDALHERVRIDMRGDIAAGRLRLAPDG